MTLSSAFQSVWKVFKAISLKVETTLTDDAPAIQTAVNDISTVVKVAAPTLAPEVSSADALEEVVMGKVMAAATVAANAPSLANLFQEAWPAIQGLTSILENHPTVASVTAALSAPAPVVAPVVQPAP